MIHRKLGPSEIEVSAVGFGAWAIGGWMWGGADENEAAPEDCVNLLYFSGDEGATWTEPVETPARGIVPDKLLELESGRWIVSCHFQDPDFGYAVQKVWYWLTISCRIACAGRSSANR